MILGYENDDVVKMAEQNRNSHFDGVVQYDYVTGELYGCSMSQNEEENPKNPVIEVFRLKANSDLSQNCNECPFEDSHYVDEEFDDDFEQNYKEEVERQIRELMEKNYKDDLEKLNEIRLGYYKMFYAPVIYQKMVFNDNFVEDCLDYLVVRNMEYGFSIATSCEDMIFPELEEVIDLYENSSNDEKELCNKIVLLLENYNLNAVLNLIEEFEDD